MPQQMERAIWTVLAAAAFAASMLPLAAGEQSEQIGSTNPAEHMGMQNGTNLPAIPNTWSMSEMRLLFG